MNDTLIAVTCDPKAPARQRFFERFCAPSIRAAAAAAGARVRIYDGGEHVCTKRQRALDDARASGERWVFECDNDCVLAEDAVARLRRSALEMAPAVVYSDYLGICLPGSRHPKGPVFLQQSAPWSPALLRRRNLVSTMSLFDAQQLDRGGIAWDPALERFQDWDLALQISGAGLAGLYVAEPLFHAYYLSPGITAGVPYAQAIGALKAKHAVLG